jgi:hypothetical protein
MVVVVEFQAAGICVIRVTCVMLARVEPFRIALHRFARLLL